MVYKNQTDRCLPCENGTVKKPQTRWVGKRMGASPQVQHQQLAPGLTQHPPGTPPTPPGDKNGAQSSNTANLPLGFTYKPTPILSAQFFNHGIYAEAGEHDENCIPD